MLTADELKTLWTYLDGDEELVLSRGLATGPTITMPPESSAALKDLFKVLLLCGQRLGETSAHEVGRPGPGWRNLDDSGSETKNGREHLVPLAKPVLELLTRRQEAADSPRVSESGGQRRLDSRLVEARGGDDGDGDEGSPSPRTTCGARWRRTWANSASAAT